MAEDTDAPALPALQLTLPIDPPVSAYGRTFDSVTLREPTADDLAACDACEGYRWRIALVARAADLYPEAVGQFGVSLLNDCTDFLGAWIGERRNLRRVAGAHTSTLTLTH